MIRWLPALLCVLACGSPDKSVWKCGAACRESGLVRDCAGTVDKCTRDCAAATRTLKTACGQCVIDHSGVIATLPVTKPLTCLALLGSPAQASCDPLCLADSGELLVNASGPGATASDCRTRCTNSNCSAEVIGLCEETCLAYAAGLSEKCGKCVSGGAAIAPVLSGSTPCSFRVPKPTEECLEDCFH